MVNFRENRLLLLDAFSNGSLNDEEFLLLHVFFYIRNMILRNMRLRLQFLLTANSGNIE